MRTSEAWTALALVAVAAVVLAAENAVDDQLNTHVELDGENVCIDQKVENKTVNITYLESVNVKEYTWCLQIPPRCAVWKHKVHNVSVLVAVQMINPFSLFLLRW
jgi:hypothetical protein